MWLEGTNARLKWSLEAKLALFGKVNLHSDSKSSFVKRVRFKRQHRLELCIHSEWASWRNWRTAGRMAFVIIFDKLDAHHGTSNSLKSNRNPSNSFVWTSHRNWDCTLRCRQQFFEQLRAVKSWTNARLQKNFTNAVKHLNEIALGQTASRLGWNGLERF